MLILHKEKSAKLTKQENEIKNAQIDIKALKEELSEKATSEETAFLRDHFKHYAEYKEFKNLYTKIVPEIAKHEVNMVEHRRDIAHFGEIIKRFDEVLNEKCSK